MDETAAPAPAPRRVRSANACVPGVNAPACRVAAAAEKLHLDPKVIEALEADRFAELGASVYVRGHLRRYADFVGEPGAELVSMLHARAKRGRRRRISRRCRTPNGAPIRAAW